ncbi:MAG: GHKL domain-containing protein [Clostridium sp.]
MENALHALEHTSDEKWVSLHIMQKENLLLLEIKNPIETIPKFIDGIPISDKKRSWYWNQKYCILCTTVKWTMSFFC